jgi:diketogulonate reductase-like aldo/keto reductase
MGENRRRRDAEVEVLRDALDRGVTLFDTAEMYGDGGAEEVLGAAVAGRREQCFIVSKVYPHNATRSGVIAACERSLRRLDCHYIDLYLLHWPGRVPLAETFAGFRELRDCGKIRYFGVSNFDVEDLDRIDRAEQTSLASNQVYYNLARREAEWGVIPWCLQRKVPVMAYCPLDPHGDLLRSAALGRVAAQHGVTPAQVALAWLLSRDQVVAIPKTSQRQRVEENIGALQISLSDDDLALLNSAHPPPSSPVSLRIT